MKKIFLPFLFLAIAAPFFVSAQANESTEGTLLRAEGDIKVYIVNTHGFRRHIPSPEAFNSYGFDWDAVKNVPQEEVESFPETNLIRIAGGTEVYRVAGEERQWVQNPTVFEKSGFDWNAVIVVTPKDAGHFNRGTDITKAIPASPATPAVPTEPKAEELVPTEPAIPAQPATSTKPIIDTTAPVISDIQATAITINSATISWKTDEPTISKIEYSISNNLESATIVTDASLFTDHVHTLATLTENTVYYHRITAEDAAGNKISSSLQNFTTAQTTSGGVAPKLAPVPVQDVTAPLISNVLVSNVTANSAVITWTTDEPADSQIDYGLTKTYASSTILDANLVTSHSQGISGLELSTKYFIKVKSRDASGNLRDAEDFDFTTTDAADTISPLISNISVSNITETSVTISWTTNESSDTQVEYGPSTSYGSLTSLDTTLATSHSQVISSLSASTIYHYRAISKDASGNRAVSPNFTFTTATPPTDMTPPANVTSFTATAGNSQVALSWINPTDDDFAGTKILRKTGSSPSNVTDGTQVYDGTGTSYTDTGLTNDTLYYYKAFTYDEVPNHSTGVGVSAAPIAPPSIPSLVITSVPDTDAFQTCGYYYQVKVSYSGEDTLTYSLVDAPDNMTIDSTGLIYWQNIWPSIGEIRVEVKISDESGGSNYQSFFITVSEYKGLCLVGYAYRYSDGVNNYPIRRGDSYIETEAIGGGVGSCLAFVISTKRNIVASWEYSVVWELDGVQVVDPTWNSTEPNLLSFRYCPVGADIGEHTMEAVATNGPLRDSQKWYITVHPTIYGLGAIPSISSLSFVWTTDRPADSQVEWGLTTSYGNITPLDPSLVTSHSVTVSGLLLDTLYYGRAKSRDSSGYLMMKEQVFKTAPF